MKFELHAQLAQDTMVVGDFGLSKLLMIDDQSYPWFVLVPRLAKIEDAYQLTQSQHLQLTLESRVLCKSLMLTFAGEKMNVAALGNLVPQLHIHHIVRYKSDPAWPAPVWGAQPMIPFEKSKSETRIKRVVQRLEQLCSEAGLKFEATK